MNEHKMKELLLAVLVAERYANQLEAGPKRNIINRELREMKRILNEEIRACTQSNESNATSENKTS